MEERGGFYYRNETVYMRCLIRADKQSYKHHCQMSGPYVWEPPVYWLQDTGPTKDGIYGGAFGFLTEGMDHNVSASTCSLLSTVIAGALL